MAKIKEEDTKEDEQTTWWTECKKDTCTLYRMMVDRTKCLARYAVDTNGP